MNSPRRPLLTKRQREVYEFLKGCISSRGFGPTVREIGEHFGIKSPNGVMCHLKALEKKGLINRESNMSRAIGLANAPARRPVLPLLGTASEGRPMQAAITTDEMVDFSSVLEGADRACILVQGRTFASLGIDDGDHIVISRTGNGRMGALIAALDDRHNLTICRIEGEGRQPVPAIPGAFPAPNRQILGIIVGVIRTFDSVEEPSTEQGHQP